MRSFRIYGYRLLGLAALAVAGFSFLEIWLDDGINPRVCNRIRTGMTLDQAVAAVGKNPGWYRSQPPLLPIFQIPSTTEWWIGENWEIAVRLDTNRRVEAASCRRPLGTPSIAMWIESPWQTLQNWRASQSIKLGNIPPIPRP